MSELFLAMVDATETSFAPTSHQRKDFQLVSALIRGKESGIPTLDIETRNPGGGLLAVGRKQWCWLSILRNSVLTPLFFGRIVGIPTKLTGAKVTLSFIAKPRDYQAQKLALAETMRVAPNYDRVFIKEELWDDPDTVLEGYPMLWHSGRTDGLLTASHILIGEDGVIVFEENEVSDSSLDATIQQVPLSRVDMEATVPWTQEFVGTIDMGARRFETYSGDGILNDWFRPLQSLQGGWSVVAATARDLYGISTALTASWSTGYQNHQKTHANGDTLSINESTQKPELIGPKLEVILTEFQQIGIVDPFSIPPTNIPAIFHQTSMQVPKWIIDTTLTIGYNAERGRGEKINLSIISDLQAVFTDADIEQTSKKITLNGGDVGKAIPDGGTEPTAPIGDTARNSYFPQPRGLHSLEYVICVGAANLLMGARVVQVTFDSLNFDKTMELSCRRNALLNNRRFAGRQALGKIIEYSIEMNVEKGVFKGKVTMGCAIGYGNVIESAAGEPVYVEDGVLEDGIQARTGEIRLVGPDENIGYTVPIFVPGDDGLQFPLTKSQVVVSEAVTGSLAAQEAAIRASFASEIILATGGTAGSEQQSIERQQAVAEANKNSTANAIKNNPISYRLELIPIDKQNFEISYLIEMTHLAIPKMYDIEAPQHAVLAPTRVVDRNTFFAPGVL